MSTLEEAYANRQDFIRKIRQIMDEHDVKIEFSWHHEFDPYFRSPNFVCNLTDIRTAKLEGEI